MDAFEGRRWLIEAFEGRRNLARMAFEGEGLLQTWSPKAERGTRLLHIEHLTEGNN